MKFLILAALLSSFSAFASDFVSDSKNYLKLIETDDARVNIRTPQFGYPSGENRYLSTQSNLDGACALFGFGPAVKTGLDVGHYDGASVVIDSFGNFHNFAQSSQIKNLMCETGRTPPISKNYGAKNKNDDGTYTIQWPTFKAGDNLGIDRDSDLNAVCRLYGLSEVIPASVVTDSSLGRMVVIGSDGKFSRYHNGENADNSYPIRSMICKP